ncbi:hypothetical protein OK351_14780 [Glutamicibacter sp. MNS18]|uniref:hypothetical protein n=1 Tax=Glutamicibacter sp. MNS18 TaxID=2989817 RepID=UPI002235C538|nr:hypothetical protein [Glutamicibacter sp. MNS18]MCW4466756.1 hypothetical protein [Glutamicibacter sp. MNS18]
MHVITDTDPGFLAAAFPIVSDDIMAALSELHLTPFTYLTYRCGDNRQVHR